MHYLKRKHKRRVTEDAPMRRGVFMTMIGLAMAGILIAVIRGRNPEMDIRPMLMMFVGVTVACAAMNFISYRKRRDDE
jgi:hypothetical protein